MQVLVAPVALLIWWNSLNCHFDFQTNTMMVRKWSGKLPQEDDVFSFYNAGSYSVTEAPALFLKRKMPVIYSCAKECGLKGLRDGQEAYQLNLPSSI